MIASRYRSPALVILASALGAVPFLVPAAWFLAPVALGILFFVLILRTKSMRGAFGYGFLYGFVTAASGIAWFWDAYPLDWLGISSRLVQGEVLLMTWLMVSASLAAGPALASAVLWKLRGNRFLPLLAATLWVLAEELRMWGFALLTWGAQSLMGPHFSMAAAGYAFTENPYLLQLARFGGIRMLDFAVAVAAAFLFEAVRASRSRTVPLSTACASVLCAALLALPLLPHPEARPVALRAALATTQHPGGTLPRDETSDETRKLLEEAGVAGADLIVFPEGHGLVEAFPEPEDRAAALARLAPRALVLSADTVPGPDGARSRLSYDTAEGTMATYDKLFFMPLGEYAPYLSVPIFSLLRDGEVTTFLEEREHGLTRGDGVVAVPYRGAVIGGLLCSETVSPDLYRGLAENGANVLVNLSNPVWFRGSRILQARMLELGKLHAVESQAYYLQASNLSPSFAIDPSGRVLAESGWSGDSVITVELR